MNKKEKLIQAALNCFASDGIVATTTKNIAEQAAVSEALLFKHFQSKQGLVDYLIEIAKNRGEVIVNEWLLSNHPKIIIKSIISSTLNIEKQDFKLVLFLFQFKNFGIFEQWEYASNFNNRLLKVFHQLGSSDPAEERTVFWMQLYGVILFRKYHSVANSIAIYEKIATKYGV
ncbi:MAG: TetR/AcrR family transcriptional regulator [Flavobacteriaceae bacterium]